MAEKSRPTLQERWHQLEMVNRGLQRRTSYDQTLGGPKPKIQRVPLHLRDRLDFAEHYLPKLLSIGPIHHHEENLQLGERYKLNWTARYVERTQRTGQTQPKSAQTPPESTQTPPKEERILPESAPTPLENAQTLYKRIESRIWELRYLFTEDAIQDFTDEELSWMLFVDGCSLLQILEKADFEHPEELDVKFYQLVHVVQDVLLLENQLPFQVLKLLSSSRYNEAEAEVMEIMDRFLQYCCRLSPTRHKLPAGAIRVAVQWQMLPIHLLDHLHGNVLGPPRKFAEYRKSNKDYRTSNKVMIRVPNAQLLKSAGIEFKTSHSSCLADISYTSGLCTAQLKLPEIVVDDTTIPTILNLIAYEMCSDFQNSYELCSFVALLDSLISQVDDVRELTSAGILHITLGKDEEVANLFHRISLSSELRESGHCAYVGRELVKHYRNSWKTWIPLVYHASFDNPWAMVAFCNNFVTLVLAFIQAWFSVPHNKQD